MTGCASTPPHTLSWGELSTQPLPPAATRIAYGPAPSQFGELRLPAGRGPFPVAVIVHGGCWLQDFDYVHATRVSQALADAGIATWTLEYRRVGEEGGGWPNTFLDVAAGADHLRDIARRQPLDLNRVIAIGHSAGGQLALWLASRGALPAASPLHADHPLALLGVLALAPITDLAAYSTTPDCGESVAPLLGGKPSEQAVRYAQVSPTELPVPALRIRILHGALDTIVPLAQSRDYAARAPYRVRLDVIPNAGHFELVSPSAASWPLLLEAARDLLAP